ncbi:MAG: hypothetical protein AUG51_22010 [Acidobacteria bacterium 13_1_20CM_3_53_8]|nr:MAG: hypothetical protein AUG51_22010 [Acidobacteria bacterium 13_1_20CM_3_53_8]
MLEQLGPFAASRSFYLGGGTAIALHLGHRRSDDLDWFTSEIIEAPDRLAADLQQGGIPFVVEDISPGTLHGNVSEVNTSFLQYSYPLLGELHQAPELGCQLASLDDLAAMKLAAISQRGSRKDFLDIYELGIKYASIERMLELYKQKYAVEDIGHVLLALSYFDDAEREPMPIVMRDVNWGDVKKMIQSWVKGYGRHHDQT